MKKFSIVLIAALCASVQMFGMENPGENRRIVVVERGMYPEAEIGRQTRFRFEEERRLADKRRLNELDTYLKSNALTPEMRQAYQEEYDTLSLTKGMNYNSAEYLKMRMHPYGSTGSVKMSTESLGLTPKK